MTKTKSTKRALLLSALSLLMCVSMLIGSTFAWFTDSVTSGNNKIVAGTLDVGLYLWDDANTSTEITNESAPIFGEAGLAQNSTKTLWEPGKTQVVYLSIKNNGNLDLKYKVALNVVNPADGKNLYEVMQYDIIEDATYGSVTAWNATDAKSVVVGTNATQANDVELKAGAEHKFALAIHMDELADNDYQGGKVNFDLTVLATQLTSESDSFNNQYDKDATYPGEVKTVEELVNAVKAGESVKLVDTITVQSGTNLTFEEDAKIDLAGNDLVISAGASLQTTSGELNIVNNSEEEASIVLGSGSTIKASGANSVVNVENVDITTGTAATERIQVMNGATFNMYDGKIVSTGKPCVQIENGTFNMYGGEIVVPSTCTSGGIVCKGDAANNAINLYGGKITVASGATGISAYKLGSIYISGDFVFELEDANAYSLHIMTSQAPTITGTMPANVKNS